MNGKRRVVIMHAEGPAMELMLAGIDGFRRDHPGWIIRQQYHPPRTAAEIRELLAWQAEGWLTVGPTAMAVPEGTPWVSLRSTQAPWSVEIDEQAIGVSAAEQLAALRPATVLLPVLPSAAPTAADWWTTRRASCQSALAERGLVVTPLAWHPDLPLADDARQLVDAILATPPPRALFAISDGFALDLIEHLIGAGVAVPSTVAVLGADDLPRSAGFEITLSSVQVPHQVAGRTAAELLHAVLEGREPAPGVRLLGPTGIARRASTDALAISDPQVAAVVAAIAAHATGSFSVEDAVAASTLSRRSIEQRFRSALGRSVLDEIHRARITRACDLLADPRQPVTAIAHACGFNDAAHFTQVFRKVTGETPSVWRRRHG